MDISKKKFVLEDLFLGDASGETEADYRENFEHFYYTTDAVKKLLNPRSYFILGRKGVGKTLLSRFFF